MQKGGTSKWQASWGKEELLEIVCRNEALHLRELPLASGPFTWSGGSNN